MIKTKLSNEEKIKRITNAVAGVVVNHGSDVCVTKSTSNNTREVSINSNRIHVQATYSGVRFDADATIATKSMKPLKTNKNLCREIIPLNELERAEHLISGLLNNDMASNKA